jgi:hypothetical protein
MSRERQGDRVGGLCEGKFDVYRQAPGQGEDEEPDKGAVLTA